jgi:hypothetical protein
VPNIGFGIEVNSSNNNLIGGTTPGSRNLISGNRQNGIIFSGASSGNTVQGNYVGTDRNGMAAVSNTNFGILVLDSSNNLIGGSAPAAGNLISGNYGGVWILSVNGSATGNWVKGNIIGPKRNGAPLASYMSYQTYSGVDIGMSSDNLIGGALGEGNVIAYNGGDGVLMSGCSTPALRNAVRRNSIYSNGKLGIELGNTLPNGVNPNDLNDTDGGHNTLQNYPILTSVSSSGTILGTLNSTANHTFEIDFFASFACDPSHYGEGQRYLGSISVVTDSTNNIPTPGYFTANFGALPSGWFITSTATDITSGGNTSEFSLCKPVPMAPPDPIYTGTVEPFLTFVPTPTLTASPIYSPTGTPVIRALLYGHVRWQGIPQPDSRNNGLGVSLTLCNANAEDTVIFATDESGVFSTTTDLPDGSYNWQLQSQKYLSGGGTIAGGTALVISNRFATVDAGTQPAGDANDDDVISITDFTNVKSSFGGSSNTCDSPFDYHADFNNDLIVNVLDFNLLKGNFGTGGAALTCP